ncbi:YfhJ family protein [Bacillus sp. FJAT-47783]|uniref:YfhJ family protein n=1 Tax=Bacillus sp. FJAT-47783 TaxID=2922712 RepID=UPI001FAD1E20|nr:YfhJ family protein [Bacillus sp. FJAT-47783]
MEQYFERLTNELIAKNPNLSHNKARTWVELLWEDFETTYAKAGKTYRGKQMTEQIVHQWIINYGDKLHEFVARNPKYERFLNESSE